MGESPAPSASLDAPGAESAEWIAQAGRIAPLIDGVEYYRHLRRSLIEAREQVLILGWDFHSEIDLLRGEEAQRARRDEGWPVRLADLLERLLERRPGLRIWILIWEGASLFALERQHLPRMKRPWAGHPRMRLEWDRDTPRLASQHEKMVVVDDRIAYAGGMDLTSSRWDDHEHQREDSRRRNPGLWPSLGAPYHDLMLAVDGAAARTLGAWGRERWRRATGEELAAPAGGEDSASDPWPAELEPLLRDRALAIVRTQPAHGEREEKRQVEASYLAQVRAARRLVYVETQYLTWAAMVEVLVERLRDPGGPEVVLILPYCCSGRLQSLVLDPRRDQLLDRLREADPGGRLYLGWPSLDGREPDDPRRDSVYVHAKALVVDDRLLRIGSSNLNNRSLGLDAELDLFTAVEADDERAIEAIAAFRRRSLAYLLQVAPERMAEAEREQGSVVAAIEVLREGHCTLQPFRHRAPHVLDSVPLPIELVDPDRPLSDEEAVRLLKAIEADKRLGDKARKGVNVVIGLLRRWRGTILVGAALLALALVWRWTPLREWNDPQVLGQGLERLRTHPAGLLGTLGGFIALAACGFPVTVLIAAVGATLEATWAIPLCLVGVAGSALIGFGLGRWLSPARARRLFGPRLQRMLGRGTKHTMWSIAILRNVPLAPFLVVNVGCGMTGTDVASFLAGTLIGMLPGIVLVALLGQELGGWLLEPTSARLLKVLALGLFVAAAALVTAVALRRRTGSAKGEDETEPAEA